MSGRILGMGVVVAAVVGAAVWTLRPGSAQAGPAITVYKSPT